MTKCQSSKKKYFELLEFKECDKKKTCTTYNHLIIDIQQIYQLQVMKISTFQLPISQMLHETHISRPQVFLINCYGKNMQLHCTPFNLSNLKTP